MSLSVIDRYVTKKEKDLLEYAKILETIISIDNNKMWSKKSDFNLYAKEIIHLYAMEFYFLNNANKDNPINYSNDNINNVLKSIVDYFSKDDKKQYLKIWKDEIFLMSVIICTACYIDFATNIVDGNFQDTKSKFKYLLEYLKKTKILHIKENKYWVNDLFDLVRKNINEDNKVFESIKCEHYYNEYSKISDNPLMVKVDFKYEIPGLDQYDSNLVKKVLSGYNEKINEIAYEVLSFKILSDLISNKEMGSFLITVRKNLKKGSVLKAFDNKYFKEYVKILVPYQEAINHQGLIKEYKSLGISVIYDYPYTENIDSKIFESNTEILVSRYFVNNNLDNELDFKKRNIKIIVKTKEEI